MAASSASDKIDGRSTGVSVNTISVNAAPTSTHSGSMSNGTGKSQPVLPLPLPLHHHHSATAASTAPPSSRPALQRLVSGDTSHNLIAQCQTLITEMLQRLPPAAATGGSSSSSSSSHHHASSISASPRGSVTIILNGNKTSSGAASSSAVHPIGGFTSDEVATRLTQIQALLRKAEAVRPADEVLAHWIASSQSRATDRTEKEFLEYLLSEFNLVKPPSSPIPTTNATALMKRASSFTPRDHHSGGGPMGVATIRGHHSSASVAMPPVPLFPSSPPLHTRSKSATNTTAAVSLGAGLAALTAPAPAPAATEAEAEHKRESIIDTLVGLNLSFVIGSPVVAALEKVGTWEWDLFHFVQVSHGRPLSLLCAHLFNTLDVYSSSKVSRDAVMGFIVGIEEGYRDPNVVTYHNALHACDVVQNCYFMLTSSTLSEALQPDDVFLALLSGALHDYQHPGVGNGFLIATDDPIAIRYNDRSVLENMHVATAFELMRVEGRDPFLGIDRAKKKEWRKIIVSCVLGTDLAVHHAQLDRFKAMCRAKKEANHKWDPSSLVERQLLLDNIVHAADIGCPGKPWSAFARWIDLLFAEFFAQGDEEKKRGIAPLTWDRSFTSQWGAQAEFIQKFALDQFKALTDVCPELMTVLPIMESNHAQLMTEKTREDAQRARTATTAAAAAATVAPPPASTAASVK